jgi:nitroreductase
MSAAPDTSPYPDDRSVTAAVRRRYSCRAYLDKRVPGDLLREILEVAHRAPSGGNLQPWRVYALTGQPLTEFKQLIAAKAAANPRGDGAEYDVYPKELADKYKTRRFTVGEDLYASINVAREDRAGRLRQFARNFEFFGAPVALFFCIHRGMGSPQWSDLGMFMQTVMLLAAERGLDTCAQEAWAMWHRTVAEFVGLPEDYMLFSGMALGWGDPDAPINAWRSGRDRFEDWAEMRGF